MAAAFLCGITTIAADEAHSIRGFFGERAAGLAGAYTAVSDDPSGAYYNPAGLAFAYDNYVSLSAVSYSEVKKRYHAVYGPGQDIERTSRRYTPGFFGAVKSFGDTKFAFTVISPSSENFDTTERTDLPLLQPNIGRRETDFTQDSNIIYLGPSLARAFGEKLSVGGTLYYFVDRLRTTTVNYNEYTNRAYRLEDIEDRRRTMGLLPILGLQYMPSKTWSLGVSVRRPIVTARSRRRTRIVSDTRQPASSRLLIEESTENGTGRTVSGVTSVEDGRSGGIPTPTEVRLGVAFFPSRSLMISGDVQYSGGYQEEADRLVFKTGNPTFMLRAGPNPINVQPTLNAALGVEYYLTERWAIRTGFFSNRSNRSIRPWGDSMAFANIRAQGAACPPTGGSVCLDETEARTEEVHTVGMALGVSRSDATSSSSASIVYEGGRGGAVIEETLPNQTLSIRSVSLVLVFSLRN